MSASVNARPSSGRRLQSPKAFPPSTSPKIRPTAIIALGDGLGRHRRLVRQRAAADVLPVDGDQDAVGALFQLVTFLINLGQCNRRSSPPVRRLRIAALPRFSWRPPTGGATLYPERMGNVTGPAQETAGSMRPP